MTGGAREMMQGHRSSLHLIAELHWHGGVLFLAVLMSKSFGNLGFAGLLFRERCAARAVGLF